MMTRAKLEARRLAAIPELDNPAVSLGKIAKDHGVSRMTVYRWRTARAQGNDLTAVKAPGRPPKLTAAQVKACKGAYQAARRKGYRETQQDFAALVGSVTGIQFSKDHMGRLMHKWGLTKKREKGTAS